MAARKVVALEEWVQIPSVTLWRIHITGVCFSYKENEVVRFHYPPFIRLCYTENTKHNDIFQKR